MLTSFTTSLTSLTVYVGLKEAALTTDSSTRKKSVAVGSTAPVAVSEALVVTLIYPESISICEIVPSFKVASV